MKRANDVGSIKWRGMTRLIIRKFSKI
jgi:hypothetical protein